MEKVLIVHAFKQIVYVYLKHLVHYDHTSQDHTQPLGVQHKKLLRNCIQKSVKVNDAVLQEIFDAIVQTNLLLLTISEEGSLCKKFVFL